MGTLALVESPGWDGVKAWGPGPTASLCLPCISSLYLSPLSITQLDSVDSQRIRPWTWLKIPGAGGEGGCEVQRLQVQWHLSPQPCAQAWTLAQGQLDSPCPELQPRTPPGGRPGWGQESACGSWQRWVSWTPAPSEVCGPVASLGIRKCL